MSADNDKKKEIALEERSNDGAKLYSPSIARNRAYIRDVFLASMPQTGRILEIASGTGEHAIEIARAVPALEWTTSDPDDGSRASIAAWARDNAELGIKGPYAYNMASPSWWEEAVGPFDGMVTINMIHIAPFAATQGFFAGAKYLLAKNGKVFLYGPFKRDGRHTTSSNEAFDASLKARDPRWGVRDLELEIVPIAQQVGLRLEKVVEMPANNLSVIFSKPE